MSSLGLGTGPPWMIVIAGPPGSGKSTAYPFENTGIEYFNADDRATELNGGSSHIPPEIRRIAGAELKSFINNRIRSRQSFAFETTLQRTITFEQAAFARSQGFRTNMIYVNLDTADECIKRVKMRVESGGHDTPAEQVRKTFRASITNLGRAIQSFDRVEVYDNTIFDNQPRLVLRASRGKIRELADVRPSWVLEAFLIAHQCTAVRH